MSTQGLWAVIVFYVDNSVATIPNIWLTKGSNGKDTAYWPPRTKNASAAVKRRESPSPSWSQHDVKILGFYDEYETAVKKGRTAEDTSDLSSGIETVRKRKSNSKYNSNSSPSNSEKESESDSDINPFPKFPNDQMIKDKLTMKTTGNLAIKKTNKLTKKKKPNKTSEILPMPCNSSLSFSRNQLNMTSYTDNHLRDTPALSHNSGSESENDTHHSPISLKNQQRIIRNTDNFAVLKSINTLNLMKEPKRLEMNSPCDSPQSFSSGNQLLKMTPNSLFGDIQLHATPDSSRNTDTDFQAKVFRKLNMVIARLSNVEERLDNLSSLLEKNNGGNMPDDHGNLIGLDLLPIADDDSLAQLEQILENRDNFKNMATQLSHIGGNTVREPTRKMMYRLLTNEIGQLYSWEGGKGKRKFVNLTLSKVIIESVCRNKRTRDACQDEIIVEIKNWLVKCKERLLNKKKAQKKDVETQNRTTGCSDDN